MSPVALSVQSSYLRFSDGKQATRGPPSRICKMTPPWKSRGHLEGKLTYYKDDEAGIIYACLGEIGFEGIRRIRSPVTAGSVWKWIPRGSEHWDAVHQKIYRNFRATRLEPAAIAALPPLPDDTSEPPPPAVIKELPCSDCPALTSYLREKTPPTIQLFAVLGEDTYESSLGDGEFHYLKRASVSQTEDEARQYIAAAKTAPDSGYSRYHVRHLQVTLDEDLIRCDLQKEVFDQWKVPETLAAAEEWAAKRQS